jgi:hypothetical protein
MIKARPALEKGRNRKRKEREIQGKKGSQKQEVQKQLEQA